MIITAGKINAVIDDISSVCKRSCRRVRCGISKAASDLRRIDHIVSAVDLAR